MSDSSFSLMLWRASLEAAPLVPDIQDLADWADRFEMAGEDAAAALLRDVAGIRRGVAPDGVASPTGGWTLDRAVSELEALADEFAPALSLPQSPRVSGYPDNEAGIGPAVATGRMPGDVVEIAAQLRAFLVDPAPSDRDARGAAQLLADLVEADRRLPLSDYRALRDGPFDRLVAAIALAGLVDFALGTRDLAEAPTGSIALLHRTARLAREGLGPYLSAVPRLVRETRDIIELASRVAPAGEAHRAWVVLLTRTASGPLLSHVIDELGDRAQSDMLAALLRHAASRPRRCIDQSVVARIRDAALDNADWPLAAHAQAMLARWEGGADRWALLGAIFATGLDFAAAEGAYREATRHAPDDAAIRAALLSVRRNDRSSVVVDRGLASPGDRQAMRLARRGGAAHRPGLTGERISAVDVS